MQQILDFLVKNFKMFENYNEIKVLLEKKIQTLLEQIKGKKGPKKFIKMVRSYFEDFTWTIQEDL